jgi:flagellar motor switch protein FliM
MTRLGTARNGPSVTPGVPSPQRPARRCTGVATPEIFDFREPLPMPPAAARLVAGLRDAAPRVGLVLGLAAGRTVPVACPGVRRVALAEIASPAAVWVPLACGLPEPGLLLVSADAAVALADLLMGGQGETEARPTTALEQRLLVRHLVPALRPLTDALEAQGVTELAAGPVSDDPLPQGGGEVVAITLDITVVGGTVRATLCLPAKGLLPAEPEPHASPPVDTEAHVLREVPLDISLRLPATTVMAEDVDELAVGDVIRLDTRGPLQLHGILDGPGSNPLTVLTAALGRRGRRRAVVVHDLLGSL